MILHSRVMLLRPGGYDRNGDPLPDEEHGPYPAEVQPLSTEEKQVYGTQAITMLKVILPGKLDGIEGLEANDKIEFAGVTYYLDGPGQDYWHKGRIHHREATIRHQAG